MIRMPINGWAEVIVLDKYGALYEWRLEVFRQTKTTKYMSCVELYHVKHGFHSNSSGNEFCRSSTKTKCNRVIPVCTSVGSYAICCRAHLFFSYLHNQIFVVTKRWKFQKSNFVDKNN